MTRARVGVPNEAEENPHVRLAQAIRAVVEDAVAKALAGVVITATGPAMVPVPEAAKRLGLGQTKVKELIASGDLSSVQVGRRRLVPVSAIDAFVASRDAA